MNHLKSSTRTRRGRRSSRANRVSAGGRWWRSEKLTGRGKKITSNTFILFIKASKKNPRSCLHEEAADSVVTADGWRKKLVSNMFIVFREEQDHWWEFYGKCSLNIQFTKQHMILHFRNISMMMWLSENDSMFVWKTNEISERGDFIQSAVRRVRADVDHLSTTSVPN